MGQQEYEKIGGGSYGIYKPKKADGDWVGWVIGVIVVIVIISAVT